MSLHDLVMPSRMVRQHDNPLNCCIIISCLCLSQNLMTGQTHGVPQFTNLMSSSLSNEYSALQQGQAPPHHELI